MQRACSRPIGAAVIKYLPAYQRAAAAGAAAAFNIKPLCAHLFSLFLPCREQQQQTDYIIYLWIMMRWHSAGKCNISLVRAPQTRRRAEGLNSHSKQYNQPKQSVVFHLGPTLYCVRALPFQHFSLFVCAHSKLINAQLDSQTTKLRRSGVVSLCNWPL
jgi:hypothetical protein